MAGKGTPSADDASPSRGRPPDETFKAIESKLGSKINRPDRSKAKRSLRARLATLRVAAALFTATGVGIGPPVGTLAFRHGEAHKISQVLLEAEGGSVMAGGWAWSDGVLRKKKKASTP